MILYIKQAGCEIMHRGRILRTPVKLRIKKSDIAYYEKMMKFKSIRNYDIIDTEEDKPIIQSITPRVRTTISSEKPIQHTNIKQNIVTNKTRVMAKIKSVDKKQIQDQKENQYHDSIESDIDLNIDVDIDSDDILKQLLSNI